MSDRTNINYDIAPFSKMKSVDEYLHTLNNMKHKYLIVAAVKDTPGNLISATTISLLKNLGFTNFDKSLWHTYIGIINKGKVLADIGAKVPEQNIETTLTIDGNTKLLISSKSWKTGNECKIVINDKDYALNLRGVNIVVYDLDYKVLIDSIRYDFHDDDRVERFERDGIAVFGKLYRDKCALSRILPKKIKVRAVYWGGKGGYFWNCMKTLAESFIGMRGIDFKVIIYFDNDFELEKILNREEINFCYKNDWNVEIDRPQIIIFAGTNQMFEYPKNLIQLYRLNSVVLAFMPVSILLNEYDTESHLLRTVRRLEDLKVDCMITDQILYDICQKNKVGENLVRNLGNPKFDCIYEKISSNKDIPADWSKIYGKKIILWLLDHEWDKSFSVSFDIYAKAVFVFFDNNDDMALIFRPHPVFVRDMKNFGIWTDKDVEQLRRYILSTPNIVWDERPDYSVSYQVADAMMMEVGSGTTISALCTRKPIAILFKGDYEVTINHPEIIEAYYKCYQPNDMVNYLNMIRDADDPKCDIRNAIADKYITHFDGKNGQRIKDFILTEYQKKVAAQSENIVVEQED